MRVLVVPLTFADCEETVPLVSYEATVYEYAVAGARLVLVNEVAVEVPTWVPER